MNDPQKVKMERWPKVCDFNEMHEQWNYVWLHMHPDHRQEMLEMAWKFHEGVFNYKSVGASQTGDYEIN